MESRHSRFSPKMPPLPKNPLLGNPKEVTVMSEMAVSTCDAFLDEAGLACLGHRLRWYSAPESGIFLEDLDVLAEEIGISRCEEMPCWEDCPFRVRDWRRDRVLS
jgi:hypothetical protein